MKNILVIGGAGYIGSACVRSLCEKGFRVTVIDNMKKGVRDLVDTRAECLEIDILDRRALFEVFSNCYFDAVMHFAAHKDAAASMNNAPEYSENIRGLINVLDGMVYYSIPSIVFSSSAAVYGIPLYLPIDESHPIYPINYYGFTKHCAEQLIQWYQYVHGIKYSAFRYFNVAGDHGLNYIDPFARNLFPVIQDVVFGKREYVPVYGNDYETRDGTCIRDYIHISDVVDAHIKALEKKIYGTFNLGSGNGQSVLEVIREFEDQIGKRIPKQFEDRRKGDPAALVASFEKAKKELGWIPTKNLKDMVHSHIELLQKKEYEFLQGSYILAN